MNASDTILVIDDDGPIVDFIAEILRDEGYQVSTATNAAWALALALTIQPDLVLCDLHMPGQDGMALIADLRTRNLIDAPIVMMTVDAVAPEQLVGYGVDFCLLKPFLLDELLACVAAYIRPAKAVIA